MPANISPQLSSLKRLRESKRLGKKPAAFLLKHHDVDQLTSSNRPEVVKCQCGLLSRAKVQSPVTCINRLLNDRAPAGLRLCDFLCEVLIHEQVLQCRVALVCLLDFVQEVGTDDAPTLPTGNSIHDNVIVGTILCHLCIACCTLEHRQEVACKSRTFQMRARAPKSMSQPIAADLALMIFMPWA